MREGPLPTRPNLVRLRLNHPACRLIARRRTRSSLGHCRWVHRSLALLLLHPAKPLRPAHNCLHPRLRQADQHHRRLRRPFARLDAPVPVTLLHLRE